MSSFLNSKRTLFYFNEKRDNIDEVLDSYYSVYNYIRENLELLDRDKDDELYNLAINILGKLNSFLTEHQNDYRRWYKKILEENIIITTENEKITVHETNIEKVQVHYYRYTEILKGFKDINEFFLKEEIQSNFKINTKRWEKN